MRRDFTLMSRHGFIYIFRTCQVRHMQLPVFCFDLSHKSMPSCMQQTCLRCVDMMSINKF